VGVAESHWSAAGESRNSKAHWVCEFRHTQFSYSMGDDGVREVRAHARVVQREQHWQRSSAAGQAWIIAPR